nr:CorA family divalent cation transporter [uncultured Friedmanniella sp.]
MSSLARSGPVPLSRVWAKGTVVAEDLTGEDLSDVLQLHTDASAWWMLPRDPDYGAAELRDVAQALDLDDLAVRDLLATDRRTKFEALGTARLVVTNLVTHDPQTRVLNVHPISIIATDRVLICLAAEVDGFQPARLLLQNADLLAEGGVEVGLQLVITAVINTYESAVRWLEEATGELSEVLFEERPLSRAEQVDGFRLRAALSQLRRVAEPMRTVLTDLVDNPPPAPKAGKGAKSNQLVRRWGMIAEQHARVAVAADALQEFLPTVFETSRALADVRVIKVLKQVSAWAAILAVLILIAGFAGMDVDFPLRSTGIGFWLVLTSMIIAAVVLFVSFRRRHWV